MVARTREVKRDFRYCDYLGDKKTADKDWNGFATQEELFSMCDFGVRDQQMVNALQRYAYKAMAKDEEKYTRKVMSVAGGGVNVPLLLSGSPECMYSRKKAPVKSKIVNLGIHCEITCEVTSEKYAQAGMLVAELVSKLEKAGYRLRLHTMDAYYCGGKKINVLTTVLKKENEPMNYARMLYPLTNVSYSRGLGFGWVARNPDYRQSGLGTYAETAFSSDERASKMDEMYELATGLKGFVSFTLKDLIHMIHSKGEEATMKYMESKLMRSIR